MPAEMPNAGWLRWVPVASLAVVLMGAAIVFYARITTLELLLSERTDDRYRARQAMLDFRLRDERMTRIESDIQRLEVEIEEKPPAWLIDRLERLEGHKHPPYTDRETDGRGLPLSDPRRR